MNKMHLLPVICAIAALALCLPLLSGCSSGKISLPDDAGQSTAGSQSSAGDQTSASSQDPTDTQTADGQATGAADDASGLIAAAEAEGKIVVSGACKILTGAEIADIKDVDIQMVVGNDGTDSTYAVIMFDEPTALNVASSGDMGNLYEDTATMVCVAYEEPEWDVSVGDVSAWKLVEGKTVTVALDPKDTWWPSDVSMPIGEPRTGTAELISAM